MLIVAEAIYRRLLARRRASASVRLERVVGCKIVSVGNLTTGGTGKTPAVQWIARHLQGCGARVAVVARGYGGHSSQAGAVVSDGRAILLDASAAGDEPLLHARALPGVPIVIGRDRAQAAQRAVREFAAEVVVLDDGFQFWSLARELDIVLLDARRPFDNGHLLPRGRLREPPSALRRAHAVLLTRCDQAGAERLARTRDRIARWTSAPIWEARHAPSALRDESAAGAGDGASLPLETLRGARVGVVSALADNDSFAATLRALGADVALHATRRDHHAWRENELQNAAQQARRNGAGALITTAKDAVKMQSGWARPLPLWSLDIQLEIMRGEASWRALIERSVFGVATQPQTNH